MTTIIVGIDLSKPHLNVHVNGQDLAFDHTRKGRQSLAKHLAREGVEPVVLEATGRLHRTVARSQALFEMWDQHVKDLETDIRAAITASHSLHRSFSILTSVPGVGPITAASLIAWMDELGTLTQGHAKVEHIVYCDS